MPAPASPFSTEFDLLRLCCIRRRSEAETAALVAAAAMVDWPRFRAVAARHRVEGLAYDALQALGVAMPDDDAAALAAAARKIALRGIRLAAETGNLCAQATAADITVVILKGTPLALLAYGTVALKHASDIDIAIAPGDRDAMRALLQRAGYRSAGAPSGKHEPWFHAERRILIELHTALVDHPPWLRDVAITRSMRRQWVGPSPGLPTLAPEDLFAYLCVHGSTHGWSRLKWLADVAALLAFCTTNEIAALHAHAKRVGAGRSAAETLLLCADLLGTRLAPGHQAHLRRQWAVRWLVANAKKSFRGRYATTELDAMPLATLRIHVAQFVFTAGWGSRMQLLETKLRSQGKSGGRWGVVSAPHRWLLRRIATRQQLRRHPST